MIHKTHIVLHRLYMGLLDKGAGESTESLGLSLYLERYIRGWFQGSAHKSPSMP